MGKNFLLAFLTLSAFSFTLHARASGSPADPDPLPSLRSRALLQNPEPEKTIADPPSEKVAPSSGERADDGERREAAAEAPGEWESRKIGKHHSSDKSVAGGGVIIGGLVTAIFAAVYCYIRVTRRRRVDSLT